MRIVMVIELGLPWLFFCFYIILFKKIFGNASGIYLVFLCKMLITNKSFKYRFAAYEERYGRRNMTMDIFLGYFTQYGGIAIFIIVLLEYMNLPGFPAGVIMPLTGVWAARGNINFAAAFFITVAAGLMGSWILYLLGYKGGEFLLEKYLKKFPKQKPAFDKNIDLIREKGCIGIFIGKLIPMVRTLISIPAGVLKMNFAGYTISSAMGICIWNLIFVGAGYFLGDAVFNYMA